MYTSSPQPEGRSAAATRKSGGCIALSSNRVLARAPWSTSGFHAGARRVHRGWRRRTPELREIPEIVVDDDGYMWDITCAPQVRHHKQEDTTMSYQSDQIRYTHYNETHHDPKKCICGGGGWWLSNYDTWEKCGAHFGPHPEMDYCEGCHSYDCWRPRGYLLHPVPRLTHPLQCSPYYTIDWVWLDNVQSRGGA